MHIMYAEPLTKPPRRSWPNSKFRGVECSGVEAAIRCIIQLRRWNAGRPTSISAISLRRHDFWLRPRQENDRSIHPSIDRSIDDRSAIFRPDSDAEAKPKPILIRILILMHCSHYQLIPSPPRSTGHKSWCTVVRVPMVNAPKYTSVQLPTTDPHTYTIAATITSTSSSTSTSQPIPVHSRKWQLSLSQS